MADDVTNKIVDSEGVQIESNEKFDAFTVNNTKLQNEAKQTNALTRELKQLKELSDSKTREQQIIDVLPQIAWTASKNGHIEFFNKRWYEYTGIINAHNLDKSWWNTILEKDHLKMIQFWREVKQEGKSSEIKVRLKTMIEGLFRWHKVSLVPVYNEDGVVIKWIGTATDIHNQMVQTRRLNAKNTELLAINHYLDHFVHAVAHDLRAPVANLKAIFKILPKASENEKNKLIKNMENHIFNMDNVITGLIKVIDAQNNKETFTYGVNVREVISEVINNEQERLSAVKAQIRISVTEELEINYVKPYINAILLNLIHNAIDFRRPDKIPVIVIKGERLNEEYIKLSVSDNGIGIDLIKNKEKLFKPYVRLSTLSKGMGLGLHIIDVMVKRNGGRVEVKSQLDKGTEFILFLKEYE